MPYSDLYIVPARGGEVRAVTHLGARLRGFTWTPDSRALVFSSDHTGSRDLFVAGIDGGEAQALDLGPAEFPSAARAAWRVAYEIPRRHAAIVSLDLAADGAQTEVAPSTGSDSFPTLAPDGRQIVFVSDRSGRQELWLADESGGARALTHDSPGVLLYPQWRGDSRHLLATRRRDGHGELIEIDSVSRQLRVLSPPELDLRFGTPGLAPGSAYIVVQAGAASRLLRLGQGAPQVLAEDVARVQVDAGTRRLLYGRAGRSGVIVADPDDLHELARIDDVPDSARDAWLVAGGALWFLAIEGERDIVLRRHDLAGGETRKVWGPPPPGVSIDHLYFSLDASGRRLVSTHTTANDTDIGLFRLIPPGSREASPRTR
jgi:dipeptidyl aminopeptidase/acylaminoacyl peptidase